MTAAATGTPTRREQRSHDFKTWPTEFRAAITGRLRFQVRRDDRGLEPGDVVRLREFDPVDEYGATSPQARGYTGRVQLFFVGYVQRGEGVPAGWCAFDLISPDDYNRVALALGGDR